MGLKKNWNECAKDWFHYEAKAGVIQLKPAFVGLFAT